MPPTRSDAAPSFSSSLLAWFFVVVWGSGYCHGVVLRTAGIIRFAGSLALLVPLAVGIEGFPLRFGWPLPVAIAYLVIFASILAVNALHTLMRRGEATRVTSLLYLPPLVAVGLKWPLFSVRPSALTGLGIAITCGGVALCAHDRPARRVIAP